MKEARCSLMAAVHPRVCGELGAPCRGWRHESGSSPRVRGTRGGDARRRGSGRFIPACAGNSLAQPIRSGASTVHPRVCGELHHLRSRLLGHARFIPACAGNSLQGDAGRYLVCGSSPRVRGTQLVGDLPADGGRFIPACAGNSSWVLSPLSRAAVHPRVCGELTQKPLLVALPFLVHPRVCGELHWGCAGVGCHSRFIPACAGNSRSRCCSGSCRTVHPRVCGELTSGVLSALRFIGSSPRVRGTRVSARLLRTRQRFIPACAGNSSARRRSCSFTTVHPRVCGELAFLRDYFARDNGSSPRVRGTHHERRRRRRELRFIPACAGNSRAPLGGQRVRPVHPRVCGELV